jgi:hypothetical protein
MRSGFARDPIRNHPRRVMKAAALETSLKIPYQEGADHAYKRA